MIIEDFLDQVTSLLTMEKTDDIDLSSEVQNKMENSSIAFTIIRRNGRPIVQVRNFYLRKKYSDPKDRISTRCAFIQCFVNRFTDKEYTVLFPKVYIKISEKWIGGVFVKSFLAPDYYVWRPL